MRVSGWGGWGDLRGPKYGALWGSSVIGVLGRCEKGSQVGSRVGAYGGGGDGIWGYVGTGERLIYGGVWGESKQQRALKGARDAKKPSGP